MNFVSFYSRIQEMDGNMICDNNKYVKECPRSTIPSSNNNYTTFQDLGGKVGIFDLLRKYIVKSGFPTFLKNIEI